MVDECFFFTGRLFSLCSVYHQKKNSLCIIPYHTSSWDPGVVVWWLVIYHITVRVVWYPWTRVRYIYLLSWQSGCEYVSVMKYLTSVFVMNNFCLGLLFIFIRGGRRCRCCERRRGKTWRDWNLSHSRNRWNGGRSCPREGEVERV
jgi:hypothetical protein